MSMNSSQGESLCTPRRAQKCLFTNDSNSCKKNLHQTLSKDIDMSSGEESDLGPMSPLALTDRSPSTCDSSPGREFISPCATPEKSLCDPPMSWDRLTSVLNRRSTDDCISPFRSLKRITRAARYSPKCKIFSNGSPKLLPSSPSKELLLTPNRSKTAANANEIIPETPQRSFAIEIQNQNIIETPRKSISPRYRLITPLGSITKSVPLPKLNRRKSLGTLKTDERPLSSEQKENKLKRHAHDQLAINPTKLFKMDDTSAPKARAALFQEKMNEFSLKNFSLSTRTFYSGCRKSERPFVADNCESNDVKRRRSLPAQNISVNKRSSRRQRFGHINAGVFHGIKRPKQKVNSKVLKKEGQQQIVHNSAVLNKSPSAEQAQPMETNAIEEEKRAPSPEIDENKRFFKTNKTIRVNQAATVTVSNMIKLKVTDGKIVLNQKCVPPSTSTRKQRTKPLDVSYDVADLTVDEPEVEATLEQNKVANILKILEDDWGDDDYDTMEVLVASTNNVSPLKSTSLPQDTILSPASELSNMTSTLNIKDIVSLTSLGNLSLNNNNDTTEISKESEGKYFPLFTKSYSKPNNIFKDTSATKAKTVSKNTQWQLSAKYSGGENQYQLDVGQKHFGATQCPECNVVYHLGDPDDENAHLNYHNSMRILKFQGWKTEHVMMEDPLTSSRIILIEPRDSKQCWKKVSEILTVVDRDLGLTDTKISDYESKKVYLYIREKSVLGVLVAEYIKTAFRMIPELMELDCCTAESTPTKCGINVVWTAMSHRRQGIATKLVDTLRAKFFYGYMMSMDDIAFSTPSLSGKIFAENYTKTRNFKVYN